MGLPQGVLERYAPVCDPDERKKFTATEPGLRRTEGPLVPFPTTVSDALAQIRNERRTHREFSTELIECSTLGDLLACLRRFDDGGAPKYLYGSAGGLYPVQTYLHVKPARVEGLDGGYFYYDPKGHRLVRASTTTELDERIYDPFINRPIWKQAAFGLYFVVQLAAIVPMYRDSSLHFATIEAGLMSQLLELHAPRVGLGLAQMGQVEFATLHDHFGLDERHVFVHSSMGGAPARIEEEF